ncbi:MAG: M28 family peptidase [Bacteroidales bacterium]|nr:M28 family peptidase [Bacteroidales bacterium]
MSVRKVFVTSVFFILLLASAVQVRGQVHSSTAYKYLLRERDLRDHIDFLTAPERGGRAAGTSHNKEIADFIAKEFESYGLIPFKGADFVQQFNITAPNRKSNVHSQGKPLVQGPQNLDGYNVAGYVPAKTKDAGYIVVGAHFDHIGSFGDKYYPGADDNASGVAALLELAEAFAKRYRDKNDLRHNFVFVAFDGNNHNMQGSKAFLARKGIPAGKIDCMVNIDQIGSNLSPVGDFDEYILVLGADKLTRWQKDQLNFANDYFKLGLCIDYTYYGSQQFYDIFYRLSDQQTFTAQGIPALLFTSGITKHTNKVSDTLETLSLDLLLKRIELIYRFLWLID